MNEHIEGLLAYMPDHPGVYLMKDASGQVIYVGKAVSLKNRVRQYFHAGRKVSPKVEAMVERIEDIETILVDTELEAFVLECNLIKKYEPYYNILLRDDKQYPYIRIDREQPFPYAEVVRRMKKDKARYFGPYFSQTAVRTALESVGKVFPMRNCRRKLPEDIGKERPCLNYHIGRCLGPCTGEVTPEEYAKVVNEVCHFLDGRADEAIAGLTAQMQEASAALQFEKAALYRDRIQSVKDALGERQKAISTAREDIDVVGLDEENARVALMVIRGGVLLGAETFPLEFHEEESDAAILRSFLLFYYRRNPMVPATVLVPEVPEDLEGLTTWLESLRGTKVHLYRPERGEKARLVEMATQNAKGASRQAALLRAREWERTGGACKQLAEAIGMEKPPVRMECYDISNIQGTDNVASMVVMVNGKAARDQYRRFRIKSFEGANDFEAMHEVLGRRFRHGLEEIEQRKKEGLPLEQGRFSWMPDLIVIDGGPVQLEFAQRAMHEAGVDLPMVSLAKREEEIYLPGVEKPVVLPHSTPALQMMQRIRDESHRFAITYHRSLRGHRMLASFLDEIPGVGPARRKALLKAYVSKGAMEAASLEELQAVPGVPKDVAERVYQALHEQKEAT